MTQTERSAVCERGVEFLLKVLLASFLPSANGIFGVSQNRDWNVRADYSTARRTPRDANRLWFLLRSEEEVTACKFNHEWLISKPSLC